MRYGYVMKREEEYVVKQWCWRMYRGGEGNEDRSEGGWTASSSSSSPFIHTRSTIENRKSIQKCPIIEHNIKEITEYNEYK